jgi:hypothetical protein
MSNKHLNYVENYNGIPTLFLDGKPCCSAAYVTYLPDRNSFDAFAKADVHLYSACIFFGGQTISEESEIGLPTHSGIFDKKGKADFSIPDKLIQLIIDKDPKAKIFPRVNMSPPRWWEEENPEELNDSGLDGKEKRRICFASEKWQQTNTEFLKTLIEHYSQPPFKNHIVGYQLACGKTEEWFPFDGQGGGIGKPLRDAYKAKHGTEGDRLELYRASSLAIADAICYFAKKTKEFTNYDMLVGAFYGYTFETALSYTAHNALTNVLRCDDIDFLCSPSSYAQSRPAGVDHACMTVLDSVLHHGKLYFTESDERTYKSLYPYEYDGLICKSGTYNQPVWKGPQDKDVSRHVLRNAFCRYLIHGNNFWWFDMFGGWYDDQNIMSDMKIESKILAESLNDKNRGNKAAEVAVLIDEKSHIKNEEFDNIAYTFRIPLGSAGVPYACFDISDFDDVCNRYKAFIIIEVAKTEDMERVKAMLADQKKPVLLLDRSAQALTEIFRSFFKENNVHIYCNENNVIHANEHYISVHRGKDAPQETTLYLREPRQVVSLFDDEVNTHTDTLHLNLKPFETKLFKLL